jgi:glycerol-3-phosphate acyltransferase PlsX
VARVAVDLLGGDGAPAAVVDGVLLALAADPDLTVALVGPSDVAGAELAARGAPERARLHLVQASEVVGMDEDPARAVRAKRDATVRVAAALVRDGVADATVSVGSTGAALAAAVFTLGRLPGVTRPGLAVVVPAARGPLVLLDAGATVECGHDLLVQFALAGSAYAQVRLGVDRPRVGLLSIGAEAGKGDALRKAAHALLADLPIRFVGNVEAHAVPLGGHADVVVTDGFTGNVLLKGLEGTVAAVAEAAAHEGQELPALEAFAHRWDADGQGGGVLLGVDGVAVVGHGSSSPRGVASCVAAAAQAHREQLVPRVRSAMSDLVARRRAKAGMAWA